jgi:hypothetical protein
MKNLYQDSKILSKEEFEKIGKALEKSWCKETATFGNITKTWSNLNPAYGQCLMSAVVINDLFGGKLVYDRTNHHYWNQLPDGTEQDFTRIQFKKGIDFVITKYRTKEEVLSDDYAIKHNANKRYKLLKQKFLKAYENI